MKKRFFQFIIFIVLLFVADRIVGITLKKLYDSSNHLEIAKIRYTIDSTSQDVLIFGSSRAQHHYIPDTIEKYTGYSVYNCGIGGQGLAFSYIQLHETLKRYTPEMVLLDLSPNILYDRATNEKLKYLLPYYSKDKLIGDILTNGSIIEKMKFISATYPYNGTPYNILSSFIYYRPNYFKGYIPIDGIIDTTKIKVEKYIQVNSIEIFEYSIHYLLKIIDECKARNIKLIMIISPIYKVSTEEKQIIDNLQYIATMNSIQFKDFSNDSEYMLRLNLFRDNLHLNTEGASIFSISICKLVERSPHIIK